MIYFYCQILTLRTRLNRLAKKAVPARMQLALVDNSGDLTTTISWLIGIAVIAGVGTAVYVGIIAPNLAAATTKSSGLVNSIP